MPCKCRKLHAFAFAGKRVEYRCPCGETKVSRQATKAENRRMRAEWLPKKRSIHTLYHDFERKFRLPRIGGWEYKKGKLVLNRKLRVLGDGEWRWSGYRMIQQIEKYASKHPQIKIADVDDAAHAGSSLAFIPHQDRYQLWGLTIVYIPQCTGEKAIEFFLYPWDANGVMEVLKHFSRIGRKFGRNWRRKNIPDSFSRFPVITKKMAQSKKFKKFMRGGCYSG